MGAFCNYHPTRPAQWICPSCEVNYCEDCIEKRVVEQYGKKNVFHFCPKCNIEAERALFEDTVVPFWNRLPKFFVYPFHLQPLVLVFVLGIASALLSRLPILGFLVKVAVWGILLKYSFAALKNTANGNFTPPKIDSKTISEDFGIVFKQLGIFVITFIAFYKIVQTAGVIMGLAFLCFAVLSIPAMIIVLVGTDSLIRAINPIIFVQIAWRIGWSYLLMYLFLMLLGGAPAVIGQYVTGYLPAGIHHFIFKLAENIYTIISYHLMGYVIYQYHEEIGYEVDLDEAESTSQDISSGQDAAERILNRVDMLIREGSIDDAIVLIKSETKGSILNLDLAERYYNLLKIRGQTPDMLRHGKVYLDLLAKKNQKGKLCEVFSECVSKDAQFTPNPSTLMRIASCFNEAGNPKKALDTYNRFVKANPKSPLTPKAYFLASNILNEKLKNPRKAASILNGLIKKYPDSEIMPHVKKYLSKIKLS